MIFIPRDQTTYSNPEEVVSPSWRAIEDGCGDVHLILCDSGNLFHICGNRVSDEGVVLGITYGTEYKPITLNDWPGWDCLTAEEPMLN